VTKHTPGPWTVVYGPDWVAVKARDGICVADASADDEEIRESEIEANARLIAAAPDMLRALGAVAIALRAQLHANAPVYVSDALRIADAAIAKAEGK
jgi:hypothetical protein